MKRFMAAVVAAFFAALTFAAPASAQVYTNSGQASPVNLCSAITAGFPVPCAPTNGDTPFKASVTTTLTQVIAAPTASTASVRITFIQYEAIESATGGLLELETGTGTNCGTGTALLTGLAWVPTTAVAGSYGYPSDGAVFIAPAGTAVCAIVTAGTVASATIAGVYAIY